MEEIIFYRKQCLATPRKCRVLRNNTNIDFTKKEMQKASDTDSQTSIDAYTPKGDDIVAHTYVQNPHIWKDGDGYIIDFSRNTQHNRNWRFADIDWFLLKSENKVKKNAERLP